MLHDSCLLILGEGILRVSLYCQIGSATFADISTSKYLNQCYGTVNGIFETSINAYRMKYFVASRKKKITSITELILCQNSRQVNWYQSYVAISVSLVFLMWTDLHEIAVFLCLYPPKYFIAKHLNIIVGISGAKPQTKCTRLSCVYPALYDFTFLSRMISNIHLRRCEYWKKNNAHWQ